MSGYMESPVTEKEVIDGISKLGLKYGASSMQGWRVANEVCYLSRYYLSVISHCPCYLSHCPCYLSHCYLSHCPCYLSHCPCYLSHCYLSHCPCYLSHCYLSVISLLSLSLSVFSYLLISLFHCPWLVKYGKL